MVPQITKEAPPVFLAATAQDLLTNYGAMPIAQKYMELGLAYELHVFQFGPHGYSVADETSADGIHEMLNPDFAQWHAMSVRWLHRIFGEPVHSKENTSKMMQILKDMGYEMPDMSGTNFA